MNREGNHFLLNAFKSIGVKASFFFFTRMAAMLSKFRIDFSDVIVITDITKKSSESTRNYFNGLIKNFVKNEDGQGKLSFFFFLYRGYRILSRRTNLFVGQMPELRNLK